MHKRPARSFSLSRPGPWVSPTSSEENKMITPSSLRQEADKALCEEPDVSLDDVLERETTFACCESSRRTVFKGSVQNVSAAAQIDQSPRRSESQTGLSRVEKGSVPRFTRRRTIILAGRALLFRHFHLPVKSVSDREFRLYGFPQECERHSNCPSEAQTIPEIVGAS